jgi:hypothetical protein
MVVHPLRMAVLRRAIVLGGRIPPQHHHWVREYNDYTPRL